MYDIASLCGKVLQSLSGLLIVRLKDYQRASLELISKVRARTNGKSYVITNLYILKSISQPRVWTVECGKEDKSVVLRNYQFKHHESKTTKNSTSGDCKVQIGQNLVNNRIGCPHCEKQDLTDFPSFVHYVVYERNRSFG